MYSRNVPFRQIPSNPASNGYNVKLNGIRVLAMSTEIHDMKWFELISSLMVHCAGARSLSNKSHSHVRY